MAVKKIRALLNSAEFPWLGSFAGRSVTDAADLNARMPADWAGGNQNRELGVPQLIFCENVLPTSKGYRSVGFAVRSAPLRSVAVPGISPALTDAQKYGISTCFELRNPDGTFKLLGLGRAAGIYLYDTVSHTWYSSILVETDKMRVVTVQGVSYLCTSGNTYRTWDGISFSANQFMLGGSPLLYVNGVGSAGNYIIPHTTDTIYWGTSLDIFDLDSLDLGAGNAIPSGLRGDIVAVLPVSNGAIIFTTEHMIAMRFTGQNIPKFTFKEIPGSAGIVRKESVAGADDVYFAWTLIGLLRVTADAAVQIYSGVFDALSSGLVESWDAATKSIKLAEVGAPLRVAVHYKTTRYLFLSYSSIPVTVSSISNIPVDTNYEYAGVFVLDLALNRWGKIVRPHAAVALFPYPVRGYAGIALVEIPTAAGDAYFSSSSPLSSVSLDPYEAGEVRLAQMSGSGEDPVVPYANAAICLVGQFGEISRLTMSWIQQDSSGVAVFGHFQLDHNNQVTTQLCEIQGNLNGESVTVTYLASELGSDRTSKLEAPVIQETPTMLRLGGRISGENIDIAIEGGFVLTDMMLGLSRHGAR